MSDSVPEATPHAAGAGQRRGRRIRMSPAELDSFLSSARTCRTATVSAEGFPHLTPLWFVWHEGCLWLYSLTRSRRWAHLEHDPRLAVLVDEGEEYGELRGAELTGQVERVGEAPRTGVPSPELEPVEEIFARKYFGLSGLPHDGRHAWLRLAPEAVVSWDFRKLPAG